MTVANFTSPREWRFDFARHWLYICTSRLRRNAETLADINIQLADCLIFFSDGVGDGTVCVRVCMRAAYKTNSFVSPCDG